MTDFKKIEVRPEQKFCYSFSMPLGLGQQPPQYCTILRRVFLFVPRSPPSYAAQSPHRILLPCNQIKPPFCYQQQTHSPCFTPCDSSAPHTRHPHTCSLPPRPLNFYFLCHLTMADAPTGDKRRLTRAHSRSSVPGGGRLHAALLLPPLGVTRCRAASTT